MRNAAQILTLASLQAKDCDSSHHAEAVHVGTFTGADAARDLPPRADSSISLQLFDKCGTAADEYLGGPWRDARVRLNYLPATTAQWQAGARFYVCTLTLLTGINQTVTTMTGSLRGAMRTAATSAFGCADQIMSSTKPNQIDDMVEAVCGTPHNAEYAGSFVAPPGTFPGMTSDTYRSTGFDGCEKAAVAFLGTTVDGYHRMGGGLVRYMYWGPSAGEWVAGDRTYRCWVVWKGTGKLVASVKNIGGRPLPLA